MATPHRPMEGFTLTNVTNGQTIGTAAMNGVQNAMSTFAHRGHLHLDICGSMVNEQRFNPAIGITWLGNNDIKLARRSICAPICLSPADTHYNLYLNYRLQPYNQFADTDGVWSTIGGDIFVSLVKANQSYELAHVSFIDQPRPPYYAETFVNAELPTRLLTNPVDAQVLYLKMTFDLTSKYKRTPNNATWYYAGSDDAFLNDGASAWPNLQTFWNGLGALSFSTYKSSNCP